MTYYMNDHSPRETRTYNAETPERRLGFQVLETLAQTVFLVVLVCASPLAEYFARQEKAKRLSGYDK